KDNVDNIPNSEIIMATGGIKNMLRAAVNVVRLSRVLLAAVAHISGAGAAKDELVIGVASWSDEAVDFYTTVVIPAFDELHPDLEVSLQNSGWSADAIKVRYASGVAPDVIQFGTDKFGSFQPM